MEIIRNQVIKGAAGRPMLTDIFYRKEAKKDPVVIFSHGFKGFKDWGHFNLMGEIFAAAGFVFVKFNFSHNGTTPENPEVTTDLEAFGNNNYSIELEDLGKVMDWVVGAPNLKEHVDPERIYLVGHSRGGGISILKAAQDNRVKRIVTWASVSDLINRNAPSTIERWKGEGVVYTTNTRTGQQLPLYWQLYENTMANREKLNVLSAARSLTIPFLIIHGDDDEAVPVTESHELNQACRHSVITLVPRGGHTFGVSHPFTGKALPGAADRVIRETIAFFS
jgi:uncharacterized protein